MVRRSHPQQQRNGSRAPGLYLVERKENRTVAETFCGDQQTAERNAVSVRHVHAELLFESRRQQFAARTKRFAAALEGGTEKTLQPALLPRQSAYLGLSQSRMNEASRVSGLADCRTMRSVSRKLSGNIAAARQGVFSNALLASRLVFMNLYHPCGTFDANGSMNPS